MRQRTISVLRVIAAYLLACMAGSLVFSASFAALDLLPFSSIDRSPTLHQATHNLFGIPMLATMLYPVFLLFTLPAGLIALFMIVRFRLRSRLAFALLGLACPLSVILRYSHDTVDIGRWLASPVLILIFLLPGAVGGLVFRRVYLWNRQANGPDPQNKSKHHSAALTGAATASKSDEARGRHASDHRSSATTAPIGVVR